MNDADKLLETIRSICKADPTKSISGLAEALGASPEASRQWKSEKVTKTVRKIGEAMELARIIAKELNLHPRSVFQIQLEHTDANFFLSSSK